MKKEKKALRKKIHHFTTRIWVFIFFLLVLVAIVVYALTVWGVTPLAEVVVLDFFGTLGAAGFVGFAGRDFSSKCQSCSMHGTFSVFLFVVFYAVATVLKSHSAPLTLWLGFVTKIAADMCLSWFCISLVSDMDGIEKDFDETKVKQFFDKND